MVKIVIGNITSKIIGHLPSEAQESLKERLSYKVANAQHMPKVKSGQWDGVIRLYWKHKGQSFYTGLMALVREVLQAHKVPYIFFDQRVVPEQNMPELKFVPPEKYQERDYQQFTLDRMMKFTRGIESVATGGGKTLITTEAISRIKTYPFLFFVLTKDLMRQAHGVLSTSLNVPIGMIGDGKCDMQKITVCTVQTAISALNSQNSKFKIDDYVFDDEDVWDEKGIKNAENAEKIRKLIGLTKGLYFDECVSGDTEVVTEKGKMRIDEIHTNNCRFVQTYDGNNIVFKPILNWWDKGERETLKIQIDNGETLICTKDHVIYTLRGWVKAGNLLKTDRLLSVNAVADLNFQKKELSHLSLNVCNTNWCRIRSITDYKKIKVYDIEVEDTHCFFGKGILVHNCHHTGARTCKEVLTSAVNAYWRFGGSATPYRESGDGIMIQAMFGSKIVDISASYLIKNKWLVKPYIFFEPIQSEDSWKSYKKVYENAIVKNDVFNTHVAQTANHLVSRGKSTLVLVQQYPQGDYLKELIPNCEFVSGRMSSKKREQSIQDLRDKKTMCMIATTLADEGLDIPTLDAALLAGGGASATRVNQRVGRTLRRNEDSNKDKSIVVIYEHDAKYLDKHAKKVRRILRKEKEFVLLDSKGKDFICGEIDSTLGIKNNNQSILDL